MSTPARILSPEEIHRPPESGTVYTPEPLAQALVLALQPSMNQAWLDPCVGGGAFLRALKERVAPENITAIDLETAKSEDDSLALNVKRGQDFLKWAQEEPRFFDRIVANPPYVALSKVLPPMRNRALEVQDPDGQSVRLGANYWFAFLCASLRLLKRGGSLGFILPAAWDYAHYAMPLRRRLPELFSTVEVHRCLEPMFRPVSDGCVVLIARGYGIGPGQVLRYEYRTLNDLLTSLASSEARRDQSQTPPEEGTPLKDILEIRIGAVTGDSKYFILSDEERTRRGLREEDCVPVLSKARHLPGGEITIREWKRLRGDGEGVWLFRPDEQAIRRHAVQRYLELPVDQGGCHKDRFKINARKPWYQTPMPNKAHGFISGMSRFGPWICLNRMEALNATNTLYVVRFVKAPQKKDEQAAYAMALLTSRARRAIRQIGRLYPDGLWKLEPGDLSKVRVPEPRRFTGALEQYIEATEHLLAGRELEATRIADDWFA